MTATRGQVEHIPLAKGISQGTEDKLVAHGGLVRAENVRFRREGRLSKRNGHESFSTTVSIDAHTVENDSTTSTAPVSSVFIDRGVKSHIIAGRVRSYSESLGGWVQRGYVSSLIPERETNIAGNVSGSSTAVKLYDQCDTAWQGTDGYIVVAGADSSSDFVMSQVIEKSTGKVLGFDAFSSGTGPAAVRVLTCGQTALIVYVDEGEAKIKVRTWDTSSAAQLRSGTSAETDLVSQAGIQTTWFDAAAVSSTEWVLSYYDGSVSIKTEKRSSSSPFTISASDIHSDSAIGIDDGFAEPTILPLSGGSYVLAYRAVGDEEEIG